MEESSIISNADIWTIVRSLPGNDVSYKPHFYQTDKFGIVSKTTVTKI